MLKGGELMKNAINIFVVVVTTLAFSGVSFAQAKTALPAIPATPAVPAMEKKPEKAFEKVAEKAGEPGGDLCRAGRCRNTDCARGTY